MAMKGILFGVMHANRSAATANCSAATDHMADVGRDRLTGHHKADVQPLTPQPALVDLLWEKSGKGRPSRRGLWYSHLLGKPKGKKPKGKNSASGAAGAR